MIICPSFLSSAVMMGFTTSNGAKRGVINGNETFTPSNNPVSTSPGHTRVVRTCLAL